MPRSHSVRSLTSTVFHLENDLADSVVCLGHFVSLGNVVERVHLGDHGVDDTLLKDGRHYAQVAAEDLRAGQDVVLLVGANAIEGLPQKIVCTVRQGRAHIYRSAVLAPPLFAHRGHIDAIGLERVLKRRPIVVTTNSVENDVEFGVAHGLQEGGILIVESLIDTKFV